MMIYHTNLSWKGDMLLNTVLDLVVEACQYDFEDKQTIKLMAMTESNSGHWQLDSLSTYQAASFVAMFFNINQDMAAERLYAMPNLAHWANICAENLNSSDKPAITFLTSGSTSKPKRVTHTLDTLVQEAHCWLSMWESPGSVYSMVPTHHIYGFIWSTLIPALSDASIIDVRTVPLSSLGCEGENWLITIPDCLPMLRLLNPEFIDKFTVVISAAPCPHDKLIQTANLGVKQIIHIYGSTETGGIGWRNHQQIEYRLRPDLKSINGNIEGNLQLLDIQDNLEFVDAEYFNINGRKDHVIQVKGMNIDLGELRASITSHDGVLESALRLKELDGAQQIYAFIVPKENTDIGALRDELLTLSRDTIKATNITFGNTLPLNDMGKVRDWVA